ncbi:MAG TPA: sulfite exporter TauE/SafE family protein, partial [Pseudolabrys sp.]
MDLHVIVLLAGIGVVAGMIASIVGGAAVVVYPALIASGLSPQLAAASNLVALMPATMLAALSDRSQLPPFNRAFIELVFASVIGAGAGAMLLMVTPGRVFEIIVPILLGFATVIFALADRIGAHIRKRAAHKGRTVEFNVSSLKVLLPVSFYGGY